VFAWTGWGVMVALVLVLVFSSLFLLPGYLVEGDLQRGAPLPPGELVRAKNEVRSTLLQGIGGLILIVGAIVAWRQLQLGREQLQASREQMRQTQELSSQQLKISERGQITERFTRAIEQLASDKLDVRIGGVYGLERLATDSAVDREIITEILLGMVHRRSPWTPHEGQTAGVESIEDPRSLDNLRSLWVRAADVADAVRVIGRLPAPERMRPIFYLGSLDLRRAYLRKADLASAYLGRSNLARAEFQGANLRGANLQFATLVRAEFHGASLEGAILRGADLRDAELRGAQLRGATANADTRWPDGFDWKAAGVIMESNN
jgi:Pentapeptide repeats (8 copies)